MVVVVMVNDGWWQIKIIYIAIMFLSDMKQVADDGVIFFTFPIDLDMLCIQILCNNK